MCPGRGRAGSVPEWGRRGRARGVQAAGWLAQRSAHATAWKPRASWARQRVLARDQAGEDAKRRPPGSCQLGRNRTRQHRRMRNEQIRVFKRATEILDPRNQIREDDRAEEVQK